MHKLIFLEKEGYYIVPKEGRIRFGEGDFVYKNISPSEKCLTFAFEQARDMNQWASRPGGKEKRTSVKMFANTFQGKFIEEVICDHVRNALKLKCSDVDYERTPLGKEDGGDLIINSLPTQIKSVPPYGNLLFLECRNIVKTVSLYERFILGRLFPSIFKVIKDNDINNNMFVDNEAEKVYNIIRGYDNQWDVDIVGKTNKETVKKAISLNHVIKQNERLGEKTWMDADNYYIVASDLKPLQNTEN